MLNFFIGLLTILMLLSCGLLTLLVLVQLPKKDAGAGMAFGAGAADALLGSGSGNALTKITKYTAGAFFVLCVALWLTYNHKNQSSIRELNRALGQTDAAPAVVAPVIQAPAAPATPAQGVSLFATNLPTVQPTNSASKP